MTSVHPHDDVRIFHRQAKSLRDAGYHVTVLCRDYEGEREGVLFHRIELPLERSRRMRQVSKAFYRAALRQHSDLYHIHDPELLPAALKLQKAGQKVIYDIHEDLPLQLLDKGWIPRPLRPMAAFCAGRWEEWSARRLSGCIAATGEIAQRMKKRRASVTLVRNYPEPRELERPFIPFDRRPRRAVYVGGLTRNRGMLTMAEAMLHTDAQLVMAGPVENLNDFERLRRLAGIGRQVDYRGVLCREDVADLLGQSRVGLLLLHPTAAYQRALPIKLFEYMLAGLPVVASDFPLWRELAGEECAVYVNPLDAAAIAQTVGALINDPQRAEAMGRAGRARALERYSFAAERESLIGCYNSLLLPEVQS